MTLRKKGKENKVGKGENAGNQYFLLFPRCFFPVEERNHHFNNIYFVTANAFNLEKAKIVSFGEK